MYRRIAAILCSVIVLALFSTTALASADVTPPQVLGFTSDKATYQVGDTITITMTCSDAESGLSPYDARLDLHHTQSQHNRIIFTQPTLDAQSGVYTFTLPATADMANGTYEVDYLVVKDIGGNTTRFFSPISALPFSIAIDNPNQTDCTEPVLESITLSPDKDLKPGDIMHITIKAHEDSGFADSLVWMRFSNGFVYNNPALLQQTDTDTLEGDFVIGNSMMTGVWSPGTLQLFDKANNMLHLEYYQLESLVPTFTVVNEAGAEQPPLVTDIQVSSEEVTIGEPVKFTVLVDPRGNTLGDGMSLHVQNSQSWNSQWVSLSRVEQGRYEGVWQTGPNFPFGEFFVDVLHIWDDHGIQLDLDISPSLYHSYEGQTIDRLQRLYVNSIFQGVDNKVLTVGQKFDPKDGITAGGGAEGDLTGAIVVDGAVDTTKPGMYLLRYRAQGAVETWNQNANRFEPNVYMDFRWVGVSELPAAGSLPDGSAELVTNDALQIVLPDSSVKVDVQRDGEAIAYQRINSGSGLYRATVSTLAGSGKAMNALVDKQGPTIEYTVSPGASSLLLNAKAKDPSGVQVLKWLPGWVTTADFATKGTVFSGTLAVTANSKYTIYAADRLGNKSIRQMQPSVNVTITTMANSTTYGTVSGGGSYSYGKSATVKAAPKAEYRFVRWMEGTSAVSTSASYSFMVTKARALKAEFARIGTPAVRAASFGYSSVKLTWATVAGAKGYEIYRYDPSTEQYKKITTVTATSYTGASLVTGKAYSYKVRVMCIVDSVMTYGPYSTVVTVRPVPATPPNAKAAPFGYTSVNLTWGAVFGATKYEVHRSSWINGTYTKIAETDSASYLNTGLTTGRAYHYKVRAYRMVGSSKVYGGYSAVVSATPVPATPGGVKAARVSATGIKLSWNAVAGAMKYEVWRATSKGGTYYKLPDMTATSYTNNCLTTGKTYYYKVRAYRLVGSKKVYGGYGLVVSATP